MKSRKRLLGPVPLLLATVVCQAASFSALAAEPYCRLLTAARVFDGVNFPDTTKNSVLVMGNKVSQVGTYQQLRNRCPTRINLGDATLLPGFIESHAHVTFQNVNKKNVLEHGITTVQDTGGPLMRTQGGQGTLRLLSAGPIIQAAAGSDPCDPLDPTVPCAADQTATGYPLNIFAYGDLVGGTDKIAMAVSTPEQAVAVVDQLVAGGASAIKISLEPGGEDGAPWMQPHNHGDLVPATPWPMLSLETVEAIVGEAHLHGKRVIAHVGEAVGFERAVIAAVDELAHMPCAAIPELLIHEAIEAGMTFVTTMDTLSACHGIHGNHHQGIPGNTSVLNHHIDPDPLNPGAALPKIIYGSEIGHDNVPWGINGEEMHLMLHHLSGAAIGFDDVVNVFKSATSEAGARLDVPGVTGLGTLTAGAPADIIAVKGNPFERFKILEYPDMVMSGGKMVVNKF